MTASAWTRCWRALRRSCRRANCPTRCATRTSPSPREVADRGRDTGLAPRRRALGGRARAVSARAPGPALARAEPAPAARAAEPAGRRDRAGLRRGGLRPGALRGLPRWGAVRRRRPTQPGAAPCGVAGGRAPARGAGAPGRAGAGRCAIVAGGGRMNPGPLITSAGSLAGHFFDGPFPDFRNMPPGPGVHLVAVGEAEDVPRALDRHPQAPCWLAAASMGKLYAYVHRARLAAAQRRRIVGEIQRQYPGLPCG